MSSFIIYQYITGNLRHVHGVPSHKVDGFPESLDDDAFLLMIQTEHMNSAYQKHAGKVLCIDSTHGTTQYRFGLVAAVVSDDNGEGRKAYSMPTKLCSTLYKVFGHEK